MYEEGYVSVWVGVSRDGAALSRFLTPCAWEDSEPLSPFAHGFGVEYDEEDCEATVLPAWTGDPEVLLKGFPELEPYRKQVRRAWDGGRYNTAVVLLDFHYSGAVVQTRGDGVELHVLGAFCRGAEMEEEVLFRPDAVSEEDCALLLQAGASEEWKIAVYAGEERERALDVLEAAGERSGEESCLREAPLLLAISRPRALPLGISMTPADRMREMDDLLALGGAVERMVQAAERLGLRAQRVCAPFLADVEVQEYLGEDGVLILILALGYRKDTEGEKA